MKYIKRIALRSNQGFLSLSDDNTSFTTKNYVGIKETFSLYQDDSGAIALQASNEKYISVDNGNIVINAVSITISEILKMIDIGNGNIALQVAGGKYISIFKNPFNGQPLVEVITNKISANETFRMNDIDTCAIIYSAANYNGVYQVLTDTKYDIQDIIIGNDNLSSLKVPEGSQVTIYLNSGFSGAFKTFTSDASNVGNDFNDKASSIVLSNLPGVTAFSDKNYTGNSLQLYAGRYDTAELGSVAVNKSIQLGIGTITIPAPASTTAIGYDTLSSLKIPAGFKVTLYSDMGFKGQSKIFTADTPYVGNDFNDKTSSIMVEKLPFVIVYADANFSGTQQRLYEDSYDTNALSVGNDQISSLKVAVGLKVILYENAGFSGAAKAFTEDTALLGNDFNDKASSIQVINIASPTTASSAVFSNPPGVMAFSSDIQNTANAIQAKVAALLSVSSIATAAPPTLDTSLQTILLSSLNAAISNGLPVLSAATLGNFSGVLTDAAEFISDTISIKDASAKLVKITSGQSGIAGAKYDSSVTNISDLQSVAVQVEGTLTLFSKPAVKLQYAEFSQLNGKPYGILKFILNDSLDINDILPSDAKISFLGGFKLPETEIIISSTGGVTDAVLKNSIVEGFNFFVTFEIAKLPASDPNSHTSRDTFLNGIKLLSKLTGIDEIDLHGTVDISSEPPSLLFEAIILADPPNYINISNGLRFGFSKMTFGISLQAEIPTFSVANQVIVVIDFKGTPTELLFTGGISIDPTSITSAFSMQVKSEGDYTSPGATVIADGTWEDPFGIPRLTIRELAAQISFSYEPPWITSIGLHGNLQIGNINGSASILINSAEPDKFLIAGTTDSINILDILTAITPDTLVAYQAVSTKYPQVDNFIKISLEDVNIYIAPEPVTIGNFSYDQGFTITGTLDIWGWTASMYIKADKDSGADVKGVMDSVIINVDSTKVFAVTDYYDITKGPALNLQLNTTTPLLLISSNIYFLGLNQQLYMSAGADSGFTFYLEETLANVLDIKLSCALNKNKLKLQASGSIVFILNLTIPNDFGTICLNNVNLNASASISLDSNSFSFTIDGTFSYFGHTITLPKVVLKTAPADLYSVATTVNNQIINNAKDLFGNIFTSIEDWGNAIGTSLVNTGGQLASLAQNYFHATIDQVTTIFYIANTSAHEIADGLKNVFHDSIDHITSVCKSAGYDVNTIASALKNVGYSVSDAGNAVKNAFNLGASDLASALKSTGYGADETKTFFNNLGGQFASFGSTVSDFWNKIT